MIVLFKNEKGIIEITEEKLKALMNDCFNEGYDLGYFDGYAETGSDCSCGCDCCSNDKSEHECINDNKSTENATNMNTPKEKYKLPDISGYIKATKIDSDGNVNSKKIDLDGTIDFYTVSSNLKKALKEVFGQ